jgi:uncharacterized protein
MAIRFVSEDIKEPVKSKSGKKGGGFASMSPERRKEVASRGGKSVPKEKRYFNNTEKAKEAGRKGGKIKAERYKK